jgi:aminomethyltransferase
LGRDHGGRQALRHPAHRTGRYPSIEGGILNWGADFDSRHNPFEIGLERLVDLDSDAEFMGKDALRRIRDTGVTRRLVGIAIDGDRLEMNATKWPVHDRATLGLVGEVTSAVWSPRLEKNIGYAWVPTELAAEGSALRVETVDGTREATVAAMPFIDPGKRIPLS